MRQERIEKQYPGYTGWQGLFSRCYDPKTKAYKHYGGRGIIVCSRWFKFQNFLEDMGIRPKGLTLDRIDVDGNYEKDNCRWADGLTQASNKRIKIEKCTFLLILEPPP